MITNVKLTRALQSGFQPNMGCMMTSFMVRESIHFAKKQGSKLFMCFLDIRQAFDRVWQDLLIVKYIARESIYHF